MELLSLGARLLHFRSEHRLLAQREERPEDDEHKEVVALEHGMARLQARMEQRRREIKRADQQRVGMLLQLMDEFEDAPTVPKVGNQIDVRCSGILILMRGLWNIHSVISHARSVG